MSSRARPKAVGVKTGDTTKDATAEGSNMDKVLKFVRKREYQGEVDVKLEKTCLSFCEYVTIDEEERVIRCKDCNRLIDPFEYLLKFATKNKRIWKHASIELKFLEDEIEGKKKELAALKRKVRAAKSGAA